MSAEPIRKRKWDEPAEGAPAESVKLPKTEDGQGPSTPMPALDMDAAKEAAGQPRSLVSPPGVRVSE